MKKVIVTVGDKSYTCQLAKTEEDQRLGLMGVEYLAPDEGMLFDFKDTEFPQMWMKNCPLEIDQIFINDDEEVIFVYPAQPNDEKLVGIPGTRYVLEVNKDSGIKEGDEVDIDDDEELDKYVMKVLAPDGSTQMSLQGGERIMSRTSTRLLIKWAKKAYEKKGNKEEYEKLCRRLGKRVFREIKALDTREPEYVDAPKSKESDDKD